MKVLQYIRNQRLLSKSGIGRAMQMQRDSLEEKGVQVTTDPREDYDIVHLNSIFPSDYWMARRAKRAGKKVVYHAHSTREDFENSFVGSNLFAPLFQKWLVKCYSQGDLILTPTEYSRSLLLQYGICKPIAVLSNGVDTFRFQKNISLRRNFRRAYGFTEADKVILSAGLYFKRKGILDFVELAYRLPQYQFIWFGYTPDIQIPAEVRRAVRTHLPNLTFAGYVPPEELKKAYSSCDLFFFPSYEETEGLVVLEALSSEIPVLIRDIPVYEDWLKNRTDVYKGRNLYEFEGLIEGILNNKLPDLTVSGRRRALERDVFRQAGKLYGFYGQLA